MIQRYSREEVAAQMADGMSGLGISLKPPKWVRRIASTIQSKIPKGTTVNVDLGTGAPIAVDLSDPTSIAAFRKQMESAKLTVSRPREPVVTEPMSASNAALIAGAGIIAVMLFMRRGR